MSEAPTLRQREVDLFDVAAELRNDDIPEARAEKERLEAELREEYDAAADVPREKVEEFEQRKQQIQELYGTADTLDHYAEQWAGDDGACAFVLEELNGDEWARTIDAVNREAQNQQGSLPEGFGRVKALEFGVESIPEDFPADPGVWPAPVVNILYEELEGITAPDGVDMGNESVASLFESNSATDTDTDTATDSIDAEQEATLPAE